MSGCSGFFSKKEKKRPIEDYPLVFEHKVKPISDEVYYLGSTSKPFCAELVVKSYEIKIDTIIKTGGWLSKLLGGNQSKSKTSITIEFVSGDVVDGCYPPLHMEIRFIKPNESFFLEDEKFYSQFSMNSLFKELFKGYSSRIFIEFSGYFSTTPTETYRRFKKGFDSEKIGIKVYQNF